MENKIKKIISSCVVKYRDIKYPRLEFKTGKLVIIAPRGFNNNNIEDLIKKHFIWISNKQKLINLALKNGKKKRLYTRSINNFKKTVSKLINVFSLKSGIKYNKIFFRKMHSKWASCSSKGNLTFNILMSYLPKNLIKYIICHEIIHLIIKKHNEQFFEILKKEYKNFENYEKELFEYWFAIINRMDSVKVVL